jgi:monofunctional biosynthetic peptidoglycan transglycosylase
MGRGKPRTLGRAALAALAVAIAWLLAVWPPPVWWGTHWPRETAMMRRVAARTGAPARVRPTPLDTISPLLQGTVILAEDDRFRAHHGIDFAEVAAALGLDQRQGAWGTVRTVWRRRDRLRGASTITQQLARNLYLSPSRNPLRKLKEAVTALRLELALSKDRILELYLNVAEWGPGLWGADAASRAYFDVPPAALNLWQAASLAATLPHPRTSNPAFRPARMAARRDLILARYGGAAVVIPPLDDLELDSLPAPPAITAPLIPPVIESLMVDSVTPDSGGRDTPKSGGQAGQDSADAQTQQAHSWGTGRGDQVDLSPSDCSSVPFCAPTPLCVCCSSTRLCV